MLILVVWIDRFLDPYDVGHATNVTDTTSLSSWTAEQFDPSLDWEKVKKIKDEWGGKVILKGILDAEDAKMALNVGADAIVVSNHGGRQLDGAISSIKALPSILDAVGNKIEVHIDGGIRTGQDILKCMATVSYTHLTLPTNSRV